nr:hypothetical protein [Nesterenkonia sp. PF2B19]
MDHQGHGVVVKAAPLQHEDLAAAVLLRGGADDLHGETELVRDGGQSDGGADGGGGDDVVPAGVADLGQRVILGADPDDKVAGAVPGGEGGGQVRHRCGDGESGVGELVAQPGGAAVLLEGGLGQAVDVMAETGQALADLQHGLGGAVVG